MSFDPHMSEKYFNNSSSISPLLPRGEGAGDTLWWTSWRRLQDVAPSGGAIPDTVAFVVVNVLLFLLIFGMSATVDAKHMSTQLKNKTALATGLSVQFLFMPLLGFITVKLLDSHGFTPAMGVTLLVITSSPGGTLSNWFCSTFNAELSLSVAMTAISTLFSMGFLPANLLLYSNAAYGFGNEVEGQEESILESLDFTALFVSLVVIIVAIVLGLYASWKFHSHKFARRSNRVGTFSGLLLVVFSIVVSSTGGEDGVTSQLWFQPWSFFVGVTLPSVLGLAFSTGLSLCLKLKKPEVVAIGIECLYQNINIATSAAVVMFKDNQQRTEALCVSLFYGAIQAFMALAYCIIAWKRGWTKAPPDEKFCIVVGKIYEVPNDDSDDEDDKSVEDETGEDVEMGGDEADLSSEDDEKTVDDETGEDVEMGGDEADLSIEDAKTVEDETREDVERGGYKADLSSEDDEKIVEDGTGEDVGMGGDDADLSSDDEKIVEDGTVEDVGMGGDEADLSSEDDEISWKENA